MTYFAFSSSFLSVGKLSHNEYDIIFFLFQGIWIRDIRFKSNLGMTQLNKLLKTMEGKKLIKSVTSVAVRSLYLYNPTFSVRIGYVYGSF